MLTDILQHKLIITYLHLNIIPFLKFELYNFI